MPHSLPADQVQMKMIDALPAIRSGVGDDAITGMVDSLFLCYSSRDREEMPNESFIFRFELVHGFDMPVWHDQDMRWRDRVNIVESRHLFVAINDPGIRLV